MTKYRKKPVVIEAFRWTGVPDQTEDPQWIVDAIKSGSVRFQDAGTANVALLIDTLEGTHRADRGDFIIQGVKGELYPCKPDIFAMTYEAAECGTPEVQGAVERLTNLGMSSAGYCDAVMDAYGTKPVGQFYADISAVLDALAASEARRVELEWLLKESRGYVTDALDAYEHWDGRDLVNRIDALNPQQEGSRDHG